MTGLFKNKEKQVQRVVLIDAGLIIPNKAQPRKIFDERETETLALSIRENGILQPINVRKYGINYEIVSGERRFRAAKLCGMQEIPCIVIEADDERSAVLALIENIQRKDLSYFEEAAAIERLIEYYGFTQDEAARQLGRAQSTVANKLRLLRFSDEEKQILIKENIPERLARALIRIEDAEKRLAALKRIAAEHLSIEQAERTVDDIIGCPPARKEKKKENKPRRFLFPVPRLYINSINKIVKTMKEANIECETAMNQNGEYYEYIIKFKCEGNY